MGRVSIVFMDGPDKTFSVRMEGVDRPALESLDVDEWPASVYYALQCFRIIGGILNDVGALESTTIDPLAGKH